MYFKLKTSFATKKDRHHRIYATKQTFKIPAQYKLKRNKYYSLIYLRTSLYCIAYQSRRYFKCLFWYVNSMRSVLLRSKAASKFIRQSQLHTRLKKYIFKIRHYIVFHYLNYKYNMNSFFISSCQYKSFA